MPKSDGSLRITLDTHNLKKALISGTYPIPRQEDIRAQLSRANYFSKLDFKSAFSKLELDTESRMLPVFHANNKLYRYTRIIMEVKPAQTELNVALKPIFSHIPNVYLVHNDRIISTKSTEENLEGIREVMEVIKSRNLTFNRNKCIFVSKKEKCGECYFPLKE